MVFDARRRVICVWLAISAVTALWTIAVMAQPLTVKQEETPAPQSEDPAPAPLVPDDEPAPMAEPPAGPQSSDEPQQGDDETESSGETSPAPAMSDDDPPTSAGDPESTPADEPSSEPSDSPDAPPAQLPTAAERGKPAPIKGAEPHAPNGQALDAASLKGVRPGHTTREALHSQWGPPIQVDKIKDGVRETYEVKPFDRVRITINDDVVDSLAVYLEKPLSRETAVELLQIDGVEPVELFNDQGRLIGLAYPERGVMLGLNQKSNPPQVFQIVVEPIDAQPFLDRAAKRLETRFADCLADLKQALELSPDAVRAQWLHAELTLRAGDLEQARYSAQKIVELESGNLEYRLTLAKVLAASGDYPLAIKHASDVAGSSASAGVVKARAYCQWGDYLAASAKRDYPQAIKHHLRAIKLAEPFVASPNAAIRKAAKELMVDAHLAVAHDVGWGRWQQKPKVVPLWINRATAFADDLIAKERGSLDVRLRVCEQALAALAGITQPPDATVWIRGLTELGKNMFDEADDAAYKAHLAWRLGVALNDAVEVEASRNKLDKALALGKTGLELFETGEPAGKQLPAHSYLRGRLCYRLGAVFAIQKSDHAQALAWYDRAVPLLESPVPADAVDCGKQGETFVSMAVSYWETGNRREALRLTDQGAKLMEQAVRDGLLEKGALAVPYSNLASMHEQLGDAQEAQKFSELASRHEKLSAH